MTAAAETGGSEPLIPANGAAEHCLSMQCTQRVWGLLAVPACLPGSLCFACFLACVVRSVRFWWFSLAWLVSGAVCCTRDFRFFLNFSPRFFMFQKMCNVGSI